MTTPDSTPNEIPDGEVEKPLVGDPITPNTVTDGELASVQHDSDHDQQIEESIEGSGLPISSQLVVSTPTDIVLAERPVYGLALAANGDYLPSPAASYSLSGVRLNAQIYSMGLGLLSILLMVFAGWGFHWEKGQIGGLPNTGIFLMLLGAAALGGTIWLVRPMPNVFQFAKNRVEGLRGRWWATAIGAVLLFVMADANSNLVFKQFRLGQDAQALSFIFGTLFVAYGLGGMQHGLLWWIWRISVAVRASISHIASRTISLRNLVQQTPFILLIITLIGLALRVWNLGGAVHIMIDELHFWDGVAHLWDTASLPLVAPLDGIAAFPHFFSYVERWTVALFGPDFVGVRMASTLFGTLTIPAMYLLGRAIGDNKTGLIAAAVLSVFPPHIHFSRLALNNIADPLFGTLAIAYLINAFRYNRQTAYVRAGIFLALSSYFYEGGRLLFLGLFVVWLIFNLVVHRPWTHRRGLIFMGIAAVLVALPYYYYTFSQNGGLAPRLTEQGRLGYLIQDLKEKPVADVLMKHYNDALRPALLHTVYSPDSSNFYYGGYVGIIPWFLVIFYLLGLFYAMFRLRGIGLLLWLWIAFGILGVSFVVSTDWTVRFCAMFPGMAILIAIGLQYPAEIIWPQKWDRRWLYGFLTLLITVFGIALTTFYFGEHLTFYNQQARQMRDFYDVWDRADQLGNVNKLIYITDEDVFTPVLDTFTVFHHSTMTYEVWRISDGFQEKLAQLPRDQVYAFALTPNDEVTLNAVQSQFSVTLGPWSSYSSVPLDSEYAMYLYKPS